MQQSNTDQSICFLQEGEEKALMGMASAGGLQTTHAVFVCNRNLQPLERPLEHHKGGSKLQHTEKQKSSVEADVKLSSRVP